MVTADDLFILAQSQCEYVATTILDQLGIDPAKPPQEDQAEAFVLCLTFTIALLESYLKAHLRPGTQRSNTRKVIEELSAGYAKKLREMEGLPLIGSDEGGNDAGL